MYDMALLGIGILLGLGGLGTIVGGSTSLIVGAALAALVMGYMLFVVGVQEVDETQPRQRTL